MLPVFLPDTDLKRNYNFIWTITPNFLGNIVTAATGKLNLNSLDYATAIYVSQLARKVTLPDDEIVVKTVVMGNVEYSYGTSTTVQPVVVEYLEDSFDTVYHFHKSWQNKVRAAGKGTTIDATTNTVVTGLQSVYNTMAFDPLVEYSGKGIYISTTKNSTTLSKVNQLVDKATNNIGASALTSELPTSLRTFPYLFPTKIVQSEVDKTGNGMGSVTVTYTRCVKIKGYKPYTLWKTTPPTTVNVL